MGDPMLAVLREARQALVSPDNDSITMHITIN